MKQELFECSALAPLHPPDSMLAGASLDGRSRRATHTDLGVLIDLQKKFSNQIGFVPYGVLPSIIDMRSVHIALENNEPCGMILCRPLLQTAPLIRPIIQAAVYMDAQRRQHGLDLLHRITLDARTIGQKVLQAICREGMECNDFWKAAGFQLIAKLDRPNARRRNMHVWRRWIGDAEPEPFFNYAPSRCGAIARRPELHASMPGGQFRLWPR